MSHSIQATLTEIQKILLGKDQQVRLALTCLIAKGHLLIDDLPGMGKTTLSHAIATVLGLSYNRIQFTSDLLPADLLGVNIFDRHKNEFTFHPGPVFAQLVLADEINRAPPKAQSALLEAMEERQVSLEGETRLLPAPFFVIATQNPVEQSGTYPLPESQLDRFMMKISLGFPDSESEKQLLKGVDRRNLISTLSITMNPSELLQLQEKVETITVSDAVVDYVHRLLTYTRQTEGFGHGLSPRAGISLIRAAKAWALVDGRQFILPDDIQMVLPSVVEHRLSGSSVSGHPLSHQLLKSVDIF
ncbi:MAG: MoxR family ATPase [Hahellaceae bacterium]|nr:MoxR family ATPase [Hahellaceae bacterium]